MADTIGINKTTVQRYESGSIKNIPLDIIEKLAKLYRVTSHDLLDFDNGQSRDYTLLNYLIDLGYDCKIVKSADSAFENQIYCSITDSNGNKTELSHNELKSLKNSVKNCVEFELFKLQK